jgi:transcriptional pleiotropic regulator of transition state genes
LKSTGITRPLDDLGRLVIPKELRDTMGIRKGEPLEVFVDGNKIILQKFVHNCVFCGEGTDLQHYNGQAICRECVSELIKNIIK